MKRYVHSNEYSDQQVDVSSLYVGQQVKDMSEIDPVTRVVKNIRKLGRGQFDVSFEDETGGTYETGDKFAIVGSIQDIPNRARNWLASDEANELIKGCTPEEKRLIGKIANSPDPVLYVMDVAAVVDTLRVDVSHSFDAFIETMLEMM